jgi:maleylpyruvate isomerase
MLKLYDYWRSSAAYRVRIALALKCVPFEREVINIKPGEDEQKGEAYAALNPQKRVPSIELNGRVSGQSMAIIEWIDETYEGAPLLPSDSWERLECRAFADVIACDVHPLNNLSVLSDLRSSFDASDEDIARWYHHWIIEGFTALEVEAQGRTETKFLFGDAPSLAEIALVPQIYNARRYDMDLSAFPRLLEIDATCEKIEAFQAATPERAKA